MRIIRIYLLFLLSPSFCLGQFPFLQNQKGIQSIEYSFGLSDNENNSSMSTIKTEYFNKSGQLIRIAYPNGAEIQYKYEGKRIYSAATWSADCPLQYEVEIKGDTQLVWVSHTTPSKADCSDSGAPVIYSTVVSDSLFLTVPKSLPFYKNAHFYSKKIMGQKVGEWTMYSYFTYPGSNGLELQSITVRTQIRSGFFLEKTYQRSRVPLRHIYLESQLVFDMYGSYIGNFEEEFPLNEQFSHTFDKKGQVIGFRSYQKINGKQGIWKRKITYYPN